MNIVVSMRMKEKDREFHNQSYNNQTTRSRKQQKGKSNTKLMKPKISTAKILAGG